MPRFLLLVAVLLLPLSAHAQQGQVPGHIPEFPDIDLRWTRNQAIIAFARDNIGRLDRSQQAIDDHNEDMRRFVASWIKIKTGGELTPDMNNLQCEAFGRPISDDQPLQLRIITLCFLYNGLIVVNAQYADSVSPDEIISELDRRYKRSGLNGFWVQGKPIAATLFEAYFHTKANFVSYLNFRYLLSLKNRHEWKWDDGKIDYWDDPVLFPYPRRRPTGQ